MSPNEIRAELLLNGIKMKDIARRAGVTPEAVSVVISGKSRYKGYRVRPFIAAALGRTIAEVWPGEPADLVPPLPASVS